jgi:hypothetical protein
LIHYAALPLELILEGIDDFSPEYVEIPFARGHIVVEPITPTTGTIVQLVSSDLMDYLNPRFQPGNIIELYPKDWN